MKKSKKDQNLETSQQEQPVEETTPMSDVAQSEEQKDAQPSTTEQAVTTDEVKAEEPKPAEEVKSEEVKPVEEAKPVEEEVKPVEEVKPIEEPKAEEEKSDKKKAKKEKKPKEKKEKAPKAVGEKKSEKVKGYITSLLKYFNIITILPITCIFYVIFFASDIVDGTAFVESNKLMVIVMTGILAALIVIWMADNRKKRRVCSLDAFLLISLLLCFGMILQCIILGHFKTFDVTAILTVVMTVFVLVFLTIRLCMFSTEEQKKNDDARYVAKSQLGLYFKVIFSKYALFISTMCAMGILLILIVTKSDMFEKFSYEASKTETFVTMAFAAVALVLMVIGLFIRIVRGRVNIVDCMPYLFILFAIGTLLSYFTVTNDQGERIYTMLYLAIGSGVVGIIWLCLCQYTCDRRLYDKKFLPAIECREPVLTIEAPEPETVEQNIVVDAIPVPVEEPEPEPVVEEPVAEPEPEPVVEEPIAEPEPEPVVEEAVEEVVEEEEVEEADDEEEEEEEVSFKSIRPRYDYTTKMRLASDDFKAFYSEIKNEFYSYGFKSRISKAKENFTKGREIVARFAINGKSMKLYLALDPTTLDQKYFHHKDMSEKKAVADIPTLLPVRSKQAVSRAKELIAMLAEKSEMLKKPRYKEKDFAEDFSAEGMTLTQRKGYGYLVRDEITLADVEIMTDEFAEVLADVSTQESSATRFIKTTVSLAELAEHFDNDDIVTIDSVRESEIGAPNANYLIVEESEKLNKKLKVYVDEITPNALKMIALAGGEVYKIWRKR
ncbi:MAG: hypothetical protein HDT29_04360 [Clostridiales bacterium]|nr:hypothetical protein [Clostridiales bacterium]